MATPINNVTTGATPVIKQPQTPNANVQKFLDEEKMLNLLENYHGTCGSTMQAVVEHSGRITKSKN
ncbi:MAG: hypothetical protein FWG18_03140 [Alphaproteobacteria bacterium]|nr:hypothetical protein [Alphaproteobacteria bacterium]